MPPWAVAPMLKLRRGVVASAGDEPRWQHLDVDVSGERRPARSDVTLVGRSEPGDEVVVNVEARERSGRELSPNFRAKRP